METRNRDPIEPVENTGHAKRKFTHLSNRNGRLGSESQESVKCEGRLKGADVK